MLMSKHICLILPNSIASYNYEFQILQNITVGLASCGDIGFLPVPIHQVWHHSFGIGIYNWQDWDGMIDYYH